MNSREERFNDRICWKRSGTQEVRNLFGHGDMLFRKQRLKFSLDFIELAAQFRGSRWCNSFQSIDLFVMEFIDLISEVASQILIERIPHSCIFSAIDKIGY